MLKTCTVLDSVSFLKLPSYTSRLSRSSSNWKLRSQFVDWIWSVLKGKLEFCVLRLDQVDLRSSEIIRILWSRSHHLIISENWRPFARLFTKTVFRTIRFSWTLHRRSLKTVRLGANWIFNLKPNSCNFDRIEFSREFKQLKSNPASSVNKI